MRNSGWPVMMAGSSDSGSALLMMVTSAGGSRRMQPEIKTQAARHKTKRARRKFLRARFKKSIGKFYFDCADEFVAGCNGTAKRFVCVVVVAGIETVDSGCAGAANGVCGDSCCC